MSAAFTIAGLGASYGTRRIVENIDLGPFEPGQVISLCGPNAAGKTIETRLLFSQSMRFVSAFRFKNLQEE